MSIPVKHPILDAFDATDILANYDSSRHRILVFSGKAIIGEVSPAREGYREMAYARCAPSVVGAAVGSTPIGPSYASGAMRRSLVRVMFRGDEDAFSNAELKLINKNGLGRGYAE